MFGLGSHSRAGLRAFGVRHRWLWLWAPVVAWAGLIFALSSIPDLGTGFGGWDLVLRKIAHVGEYAVLGALLFRALDRRGLAVALGIAYAVSDEIHQSFVTGREGAPLDVGIDAVGVVAGVVLWQLVRQRRGQTPGHVRNGQAPAVAIDLDGALGDTRQLWLAWLESVRGLFGLDGEALPEDRAAAAAELDRRGAGNWRTLLERFGEERAAVYLRRDPAVSAALRALAAEREVGIYTDAPEALARVALSQLGADRRSDALETGESALERLLDRLGDDAVVVRTRDELLAAAST